MFDESMVDEPQCIHVDLHNRQRDADYAQQKWSLYQQLCMGCGQIDDQRYSNLV